MKIAVYPTTNVVQGKWFVFYCKENKIQVKELIDKELPKMIAEHQSKETTNTMTPPPQQICHRPLPTSVMNYVKVVAANLTTNTTSTHTQPPQSKQKIQVSYAKNTDMTPGQTNKKAKNPMSASDSKIVNMTNEAAIESQLQQFVD